MPGHVPGGLSSPMWLERFSHKYQNIKFNINDIVTITPSIIKVTIHNFNFSNLTVSPYVEWGTMIDFKDTSLNRVSEVPGVDGKKIEGI